MGKGNFQKIKKNICFNFVFCFLAKEIKSKQNTSVQAKTQFAEKHVIDLTVVLIVVVVGVIIVVIVVVVIVLVEKE